MRKKKFLKTCGTESGELGDEFLQLYVECKEMASQEKSDPVSRLQLYTKFVSLAPRGGAGILRKDALPQIMLFLVPLLRVDRCI